MFPKTICETKQKVPHQHAVYRCRSPKDGGAEFIMHAGEPNEYKVTNADVVPYNPSSLLRIQGHFCFDICSKISAVKYIYKYMLRS